MENARGYITTTVYDAYGRVWATEDARGHRNTTLYDLYGRVAGVQEATGVVWTTIYDYLSREWATEDPLGGRITNAYDLVGRVYAIQDECGWVTTTVYDALGRVWATVDPLGQRTTSAYDLTGKLQAVQDARGFLSSYVWDAAGNRVAEMDALGAVTSFGFDGIGREIWVQGARGYVVTTHYDSGPQGRVIASEDPFGYRTTLLYDAVAQEIGVVDALGHSTTTVYDLSGNPWEVIDPQGKITTTSYNGVNRSYEVRDALGHRVTYFYDSVNNQVARLTPLGSRWSTAYDALNREASREDPLGRCFTTSYDAAGRVVGQWDALDRRTTLTYNSCGEETERVYADGSRVTTYYDAARRATLIWDEHGPWLQTWDQVGNLRSFNGPTHPAAVPLSFAYDAVGHRVRLEGPWGTFTYAYDLEHHLLGIHDPGYGSVPGGRTTWSYEARGLCWQQVNANGTRTTWTYDPLARISQIQHESSAGVEVDYAFYSYDPAGNPHYRDTSAGRVDYDYDAVNRLTGESHPTAGATVWECDADGHRTLETGPIGSQSYSYDRADQLRTVTGAAGATSYGYDAIGSRISAQAPTGAITTYQWDVRSRLENVLLPSGAAVANAYRFDDLRINRSGGGDVRTFVWDGDNLLSQWGPISTQLYVQTPDALVRALGNAGGSALNRQYHLDALGTVEALTVGLGIEETTYEVDAWGNVLAGAAAENPFVFGGGLGYWSEPDLDLEYVRARWLDTRVSHWLSVDPETGQPRYTYAANQPTRATDRTGRAPAGAGARVRPPAGFVRSTGGAAGASQRFRVPNLLLQMVIDLVDAQTHGSMSQWFSDAAVFLNQVKAGAPVVIANLSMSKVQDRNAYWDGFHHGVQDALIDVLIGLAIAGFAFALTAVSAGLALVLSLVAFVGMFVHWIVTQGGSFQSIISFFVQPILGDLAILSQANPSDYNRGYATAHLILEVVGMLALFILGLKLPGSTVGKLATSQIRARVLPALAAVSRYGATYLEQAALQSARAGVIKGQFLEFIFSGGKPIGPGFARAGAPANATAEWMEEQAMLKGVPAELERLADKLAHFAEEFSKAGGNAEAAEKSIQKSLRNTVRKVAEQSAPRKKGLTWVYERVSSSKAALDYDDAFPGASPRDDSGGRLVPALFYDNPNKDPRARPYVKFDHQDPVDPYILVDRKLAITTKSSQRAKFKRNTLEALAQNHEYRVRVEVPNAAQEKVLQKLLLKTWGAETHPQITVKIVPILNK